MTYTPWGASQDSHRYDKGIVFYDTASHGGFHLTPSREAELDAFLRTHGMSATAARMGYDPGWYEEDCCAYAVLACWPELFPNHEDGEPATTRADCIERLRYWIGV